MASVFLPSLDSPPENKKKGHFKSSFFLRISSKRAELNFEEVEVALE